MRYFFWIIITFPFLCLGSIILGRYLFNEINQLYGIIVMLIPTVHIVFAVLILNKETESANKIKNNQ